MSRRASGSGEQAAKLIGLLAVGVGLLLLFFYQFNPRFNPRPPVLDWPPGQAPLSVERLAFTHDEDGDGINDLDDLVQGAYQEAGRRPSYHSAYYAGGYPPADEGVCTDVIWRALKEAGYSLKDLMDADIRQAPQDYPRVKGRPEPNIDFRRVPNQTVFFQKYADSLTTEVISGDAQNLREWQRGDIVVFAEPLAHIGIISDRRRRDGVPYVIHNGGPYAKEADVLLDWPTPIVHHFRFPASLEKAADSIE